MDTAPSGIGTETILLLPSEIKIIPECNVRPFSSTAESSAVEDRHIEALAAMIEDVGQLDSLVITERHELIAGHRRRRAVMLINERRTARGQSLLRLRCSIDHSGGDLRRRSIISNLHRKDSSPMDLAYLIVHIRKDNHWEGPIHTHKVAKYLGCSYANVLQHERFLAADRETQHLIHSGLISAKSALNLLKALDSPQERAKVVQRAEVIQEEEKVERAMALFERHKRSMEQTTVALQAPIERIESPAIVKAIRERHKVTPAASRKGIALTRAELIGSIERLDTPGCPGPCHDFLRYLLDVYACGQGSVDELRSRFARINQPHQPPLQRPDTLLATVAS